MTVSPTAKPPNIRARCEIDLSPGTAISPASRLPGRAVLIRGGVGAFTRIRSLGSLSGSPCRAALRLPHRPRAAIGCGSFPAYVDKGDGTWHLPSRFLTGLGVVR